MTHTPGPWGYGRVSGEVYSRTTGRHIATLNRSGMDSCPDWVLADAAIIVEAPALLAAARGALAALSQRATCPADVEAAKTFLRDAIARVEGGQP